MSTIGAYEAKTRFSQLLERVAAGEEITITKHGRPVARLIPAALASSIESRRAAIQRMRELASHHRLDGLSVRELIAEGRK
jgi:prevent-host-death family protein